VHDDERNRTKRSISFHRCKEIGDLEASESGHRLLAKIFIDTVDGINITIPFVVTVLANLHKSTPFAGRIATVVREATALNR
jgi:shikimate 5-dehydrogenase